MRYSPTHDHYFDAHNFGPTLEEQMQTQAMALCQALGYSINSVEFAIRNGIPYAIDFMNPVPSLDRNELGEKHFSALIDHLTTFVLDVAEGRMHLPRPRLLPPPALTRTI
ncbi:MAG: hypothetical protein HC915_01040 [Anaerolineae bacterium]|nr:hypothetical protein [Anaerolineae bacterium]